ncbi:uncharacterized protein LOC123540404 [Mercenaria mercenaria]|uniref:uncharacterized protein LOC123540404 n=1 Tax=Mercenaria mercenaria TaxID=6596 RepID=UPI00234E665B|nr:uncharacterized protein LOC123540404 [Mercenaria mercenaria]
MDDLRKRSTTRIRKPSAKLKASLSVSFRPFVSQQKKNQVDSDQNASNETSAQNATEKRKGRTRSNRQADARIKSNFYCLKTSKETVKKTRTESSSIVLKSSKSDDHINEADVKKSDKVESKSGRNVGSSHETKSGMEVNSEQETVAGSSTEDVLKSEKNHTVQEIMVDNMTTDALKPVKKRTVQVCVRLKDMILIPEEKKVNKKVFEQSTLGPKNIKNELKSDDDKRKRRKLDDWDNSAKQSLDHEKCDDLSCDGKDFLKEGYDFGSVQTSSVFKEDGSFAETYDSKTNCKEIGYLSETSFENNRTIKIEECKGIIEEIDTGKNEGDKCRGGIITKDVNLQAEIDFDDLDASDEEVSDVDEASTEKSHQCPVCSKVFGSKCNLRKHQALHTDDKPFQCEICGMSFALKSYLRVHSVVHSGYRKHKCDICNKAFLRRCNLNAHKRSHTDVKAYSCDTCGKKFKSKLGRDAHLKEHDPKSGYQCHKCGKSYSQKAYLSKHISIHAGVKPFKCTICGKSFPYNQSLQEHMRRHTGENPETCDICGKSFNNKRQLRKHMQYHNTVSQFACDECNMFYDSQQSLNKHFTKTHNRRHECDFCIQTFVNKKHLKSHQAHEHKEHLAAVRKMPAEKLAKAKKVACSLCHRVFFNRYVLSKHLMSKHQLGEQDMKTLLNIRKKAISKKQMDQHRSGDMVEDFDKVLENDKSFRVYYKDDEMAVYVKGTENFDSRLKAMAKGTHTALDDNVSDQEVRYIVLEDNELVNANEYVKIGYAEDASETINLKDNVIERVYTELDEKGTAASNMAETRVQNVDASDQNYYMVFTEANETSEKIVEEIESDSKFVSEAEIQTLSEDGAERIVLILNEGEDGKSFMLENGEHYEILADGADFLHEGKQAGEYETGATGPMEMTDGRVQKSFETNGGSIIGSSDDAETVINHTSVEVNAHNLPLLEQLQTHERVSELKSERNSSEDTDNRETKEECQNKILHQLINSTTSTQNKESPRMQYQRISKSRNINIVEGKNILIPDLDNIKTECPVSSDTNQDTASSEKEATDLEELLPKNSSAQEFANFENALKSKSEDFQNAEDYNEFLDKMIQTLQKAKQTHPK